MQHFEGSGTPVLYIGRTILKGLNFSGIIRSTCLNSKILLFVISYISRSGSRDSAVSIAIWYVLDGSRIKSRRRRNFLLPSVRSPGPIQPPVQLAPGIFTLGKAAVEWH